MECNKINTLTMLLTRNELINLLEKAKIETIEVDISIIEHHETKRQSFFTDIQNRYANARIYEKVKDKLEMTLKADINEWTGFVGFERH